MSLKPVKLADIAQLLESPVPSDGDRLITGIAAITDAAADEITMVSTPAYVKLLARTASTAIIVQRKIKLPSTAGKTIFRVDDVEAAVSAVLSLFAPPLQKPAVGIHPTAQIARSAVIEPEVAIGAHVVIGERARIGTGSLLHSGVIVGDDVILGNACELFPNVVVRERITLGARVIINAGSVLGTDGFGYRWDGRQHLKVPHIGTVIIEDDVELGSCVCVDRAKFGATRIGRGTKIDNLVQIAHNVQIGPHCIIVAQTGIAGSTRLGTGVILGGQTAVRDHVVIGDNAMAAARSAIASNVPPQTSVSGMPALPHRQSLREQSALRRLPELLVQMRKLEQEIKNLKQR